jgi:hypothetical protein
MGFGVPYKQSESLMIFSLNQAYPGTVSLVVVSFTFYFHTSLKHSWGTIRQHEKYVRVESVCQLVWYFLPLEIPCAFSGWFRILCTLRRGPTVCKHTEWWSKSDAPAVWCYYEVRYCLLVDGWKSFFFITQVRIPSIRVSRSLPADIFTLRVSIPLVDGNLLLQDAVTRSIPSWSQSSASWMIFFYPYTILIKVFRCPCATISAHVQLFTPTLFSILIKIALCSVSTTLVYNMCVGYIITLCLQQTWISALVFTQNQLSSLVAARRETFLSFLRLSAVRLVFCTINGSISTISRLSTPIIHGRCLLLYQKQEWYGEHCKKKQSCDWRTRLGRECYIAAADEFWSKYTHLWPLIVG